MSKKIIGVLGFIGSGKGTIGNYLVSDYNFVSVSFAAALKDTLSAIFKWPRDMLEGDTAESRIWRETEDIWWSKKLGTTVTPRWAMQQIGTDLFRHKFHNDIWSLSLERLLHNCHSDVVVTDVRFPNELEMVKNLNGQLWWVKREIPNWYDIAQENPQLMPSLHPLVHVSEYIWINSGPFIELDNTSTLDNLKLQIDRLL
jgi:hypothetical protein